MRGLFSICLAFATLLLLAVPSGAAAQPDEQRGANATPTPAVTCAALQNADFGTVREAPTQITSAKFVTDNAALKAHCEVIGYVSPNIGFELWLPASNWNQKFVKLGCGGFCGSIFTQAQCPPVVARGYACIAGNMGHTSTALDAKWAFNTLATQIDFGFRSTHVTTVAGKAITAAFYGRAPKLAYHLGCSTGGREGMIAAQRFPNDFDGIVVGAPPINETGDGLALLWNVMALNDAHGRALLTSADLDHLHAAVVAECDALDGVKDGVISDPRRCRFDPAKLACARGVRTNCLTDVQVAAVRKVYGGAVNSKGQPLYTSRSMPGSELNWKINYVSDSGPAGYAHFIGDMMRYMNFWPALGPNWQIPQFDWDVDPQHLDLMESLYTASNPDLRRFKAHNGKMIVYQGWADHSVLPENIIDYHDAVEREMGGRAPTQEFFRLFMVPGMNHCTRGEGASVIDYLTYLERWVERGQAPDALIAAHLKANSAQPPLYGGGPLVDDQVEFSRPIFPYPLQAALRPSANQTLATSYEPK